jgi:hypothetical protein
MNKEEWRAAIKSGALQIDNLNLTSLPFEITPEDPESLHQGLSEKLQAMNEIAKPGAGLELTIGRGGYVKWEHYDAMAEPTAEIWMKVGKNGYYRLKVRVPKGVKVIIEEVTEL